MDCLFCKVVNGSLPATIIYQDENVVAFNDINPQAPQHKLIIPRKHIATLNDLSEIDAHIIGELALTAKKIADQLNIADSGYRFVINCNAGAGQSVFHIHAHLLGGRQMMWPPG